jgi:hypothetical protein
MRRKSLQGVAIIEFALSMMVIVPLLLGTIACGLQLVQSMQTIQLARDSGRMYARRLDFGQPGNQTILASLGADLGLHIDGTGNAVVILSTVKYMDSTICPTGLAACSNYQQWVFAQRLTIGNASYRTSGLGSPLTSGPGKVTMDSGGNIADADQRNNSNDRAYFNALGNPFVDAVDKGVLDNLPSGQILYVSEAASKGFTMPPFATGGMLYAYNVF